jgi:hypothetical protein
VAAADLLFLPWVTSRGVANRGCRFLTDLVEMLAAGAMGRGFTR